MAKETKHMERSIAAKKIMDGEKLMIGEYRSSEAATITWRDKATRATLTGVSLNHNCEDADGKAYVVSERVPETFKPSEYVRPFKKGTKVVVVWQSCSVKSGRTTYYGKPEELTGAAATVTI